MPALGIFDAPELDTALARPPVREVRRLLRELGPGDRPSLAGACTGSFRLADAGCLHGHRATTSWWLSSLFHRRCPEVRLDMSRMVVESGTIVTSRRTLERRTRDRLGITPPQLVQQLRVERAHHLCRTTELSMQQVAHAVGYRNAATLPRLLRSRADLAVGAPVIVN